MRPHEIGTVDGNVFDITKTDNYHYPAEEIAHVLSNTCMYNGHTEAYYSLAQHSVILSKNVSDNDALAALLSKGAIAYVGNIIPPIKQMLKGYTRIRNKVTTDIYRRHGVLASATDDIETVRKMLTIAEWRDLMDPAFKNRCTHLAREYGVLPIKQKIVPLMPEVAFELFMVRYEELSNVGKGNDKKVTGT